MPGYVRLGYEIVQCPDCQGLVNTGAFEWAHMTAAQRWGYLFSYWVLGLLVLIFPLTVILVIQGHGPISWLPLGLILPIWLAKLVRVWISLHRCPTLEAPSTFRERRPISAGAFWVMSSIVLLCAVGIAFLDDGLLKTAVTLIAIMMVVVITVIYRIKGFQSGADKGQSLRACMHFPFLSTRSRRKGTVSAVPKKAE